MCETIDIVRIIKNRSDVRYYVVYSEANVNKRLVHLCIFIFHPPRVGQNPKIAIYLKYSWAVSNQNIILNTGVRAI
jgi:hypothetical protein